MSSNAPRHPHGPVKHGIENPRADSAIPHAGDGTIVNVHFDDEGHIAWAENTDAHGVYRKIIFPPWPKRNRVEYQETGKPPFVITLWTTKTDFVYTYDDGKMRVDYVFIPHSPLASPQLHYKTIWTPRDGRPQKDTPKLPLKYSDLSNPTLNPMRDVIRGQFHDWERGVGVFGAVLKRAETDVYQFDEETLERLKTATDDELGQVFYKLGWGTIGRAVIWGLAGAVGVLATAPAAGAAASAYAVAFLAGFDASGMTEIWSSWEDSGGFNDNEEKKKKQEEKDAGTKGGSGGLQ